VTAGGKTLADAPGDARPQGTDAVLLSIAVVAVSTSGPLIAATAAPALAIAFWRNAMASGLLLPVVLATCRDELRALDRRELRWAGLAGLFLALHFATWIPALGYTSVASATALVATQPVWAALLSTLRGSPVSRPVWVGIGVAMAGALLLTGVDLQVSADALLGDLLALAGGAFAAAYMVAGSEVRRSVSTTTYTFLCYSTALIMLGVCLIWGQQLTGYDARTWRSWPPHRRRPAARALAVQPGAPLDQRHRREPRLLLRDPGAALVAASSSGQTPPLLALPAAALLVAGLAS
jgi:drug/metabolite transporter (DMT)-like permease